MRKFARENLILPLPECDAFTPTSIILKIMFCEFPIWKKSGKGNCECPMRFVKLLNHVEHKIMHAGKYAFCNRKDQTLIRPQT